jgi:hypothetical protein
LFVFTLKFDSDSMGLHSSNSFHLLNFDLHNCQLHIPFVHAIPSIVFKPLSSFFLNLFARLY